MILRKKVDAALGEVVGRFPERLVVLRSAPSVARFRIGKHFERLSSRTDIKRDSPLGLGVKRGILGRFGVRRAPRKPELYGRW
jgi:hypothetical protein